jgi:integrase
VTTHNTILAPAKTEKLGTDPMTFGLSDDPSWGPIIEWAEHHRCLPGFLLLIITHGIHEYPNLVGWALEEISNPDALRLLRTWSQDQGNESSAILTVAEAAFRNPDIFNLTKRPNTSQTPAAQIPTSQSVSQLFLPSLAAQHYPFTESPESQAWYRTLRCWILIHCGIRTTRGNTRDTRAQSIARGLRIAGKPSMTWRQLIIDSPVNEESFAAINQYLLIHAERFLEKTKPSNQRDFLNALRAIARYEDHPENVPQHSAFSFTPQLLSQIEGTKTQSTAPAENWLTDEPEPELPESVYYPETESSEALSEVATNPNHPPPHQALVAKGAILVSAEERHFLPWSWSTPNPFEIKLLFEWIDELSQSLDAHSRLLASLVWIAIRTARSLRRALDIEIGDNPAGDWRMASDASLIHRKPPIRGSSWLPHSDEERTWVTNIGDQIQIFLPGWITESLRKMPGYIDFQLLGDYWARNEISKIETTFKERLPTSLSRVTPGILGGIFPRLIHQARNDDSYARLLTSHPRSGLPAACGYAQWDTSDVSRDINSAHAILASCFNRPTLEVGLGSQCCPIEDMLKSSLNRAYQLLVQASTGTDLVTYHNLLTAYLTLAVWAATGCRPVNDTLESLDLIDTDESLLFVEDKYTGGTRNSRVVPLPRSLCAALTTDYIQHLKSLAERLHAKCPNLAIEINKLTEGPGRKSLPFLFFLSRPSNLQWESITGAGIDSLDFFDCPLPKRLFRHRLANTLRDQGISSEIIDGVLGHGESGGATYSIYSPRCFAKDLDELRPAIEASFSALDFKSLPKAPLPQLTDEAIEGNAQIQAVFGARAREKRRRQSIKRSILQAHSIIQEHTKDCPLENMDEDRLMALSRALFFRPESIHGKAIPKADGFLQYTCLLKAIDKLWKNKGKRVRLPRRYAVHAGDRPLFNEHAIGALAWWEKADHDVVSKLSSLPPSSLALADARLLGAMLVCLESRVSDHVLLLEILDGKNYRIVHHQGYFLEHSQSLPSDDPDIPVRRYPISQKAAIILDRALSSKAVPAWKDSKIPTWTRELARSIFPHSIDFDKDTVERVISHLSLQMEQVNAISLPGQLAGYLSGQILSAALPWSDVVRMVHNQRLNLEDTNSNPEIGIPEEAPAPVLSATAGEGPDDTRIEKTRKFFDEARATLDKLEEQKGTPNARRDGGRKLRQLCRDSGSGVSSAAHLLVQWSTHLLNQYRGAKSKGTDNLLKPRSILRYFGALSPRIQSIGYGIDLVNLDETEITDFYDDVLTCIPSTRIGYVGRRLIEFHEWARQYGVEEPDWSELPLEAVQWAVSPGIILEQDYQDSLQYLIDHSPDGDLGVKCAFLLFLSYRFALRGKEALGLSRSDWTSIEGQYIVTVRKNRYRDLKSSRSRRQVPLVFTLSDLENGIVEEMLARVEAKHGDDYHAPIFGDHEDARRMPQANNLKSLVITALKAITNNPRIVLHHARHTAGQRIALALLELPLTNWEFSKAVDEAPYHTSHIQQALLGIPGVTRRTPWALARYLGHASTVTAPRSYLHFFPDWLSSHLTFKTDKQRKPLKNCLDIEALRADKVPPAPMAFEEQAPPTITPSSLMHMMRLASLNRPLHEAAAIYGIHAEKREQLEKILDLISRTRFTPREGEPEMPFSFLTRITSDGWMRMNNIMAEAERSNLRMPLNFDIEQLNGMIGDTRQLLLTDSSEFARLRSLVTYLSLEPDDYQLIATDPQYPPHYDAALENGFTLLSREAVGTNKKAFRIDKLMLLFNANVHQVRYRVAFCVPRNRTKKIRNRLEFLLLAVACAIANQPTQTVD